MSDSTNRAATRDSPRGPRRRARRVGPLALEAALLLDVVADRLSVDEGIDPGARTNCR